MYGEKMYHLYSIHVVTSSLFSVTSVFQNTTNVLNSVDGPVILKMRVADYDWNMVGRIGKHFIFCLSRCKLHFYSLMTKRSNIHILPQSLFNILRVSQLSELAFTSNPKKLYLWKKGFEFAVS